MRKILLFLTCLVACVSSFAQPDSAALAKRDSLRMAKMLESAVYPLIKGAQWAGVITVENPEEVPDTKQQYKLLMDFSTGPKTGKAKDISGGLTEVARIINLHIAAGVPQKNLHVVVIAHGPALFSMLTDTEYEKKFHCPNPNVKLIDELVASGVQFTGCGQAMKFLSLEKSMLSPVVKVGYSAKTVTSNYSMKGYLVMDVSD